MYGNRLHTWWSTQSRLATLLSSSIVAGGSDFRLYDGSDLKTLSIDEKVGPDAFAVCRAHRGWISFAPVFSFLYC